MEYDNLLSKAYDLVDSWPISRPQIVTISKVLNSIKPWTWFSCQNQSPIDNQANREQIVQETEYIIFGKLDFQLQAWGEFVLVDHTGSISVVIPEYLIRKLPSLLGNWVLLPSWFIVPYHTPCKSWRFIGPASISNREEEPNWPSWPSKQDKVKVSRKTSKCIEVSGKMQLVALRERELIKTVRVLTQPTKTIVDAAQAFNVGNSKHFNFVGKVTSCSPVVQLSSKVVGVLVEVQLLEIMNADSGSTGKVGLKIGGCEVVDHVVYKASSPDTLVNICFPGVHNSSWSRMLQVGNMYLFRKLMWSTLGTKKSERLVLMCPNDLTAQVYALGKEGEGASAPSTGGTDEPDCLPCPDRELHQKNNHSGHFGSRPEDENAHLVTSKCVSGNEYVVRGHVTRLIAEAVLEVDNTHLVLLTHVPLSGFGKGIRIGTRIEIRNALFLGETHGKSNFGLTFRSQVRILALSKSMDPAWQIDYSKLQMKKAYRVLTMPQALWMFRSFSLLSRMLPRHFSSNGNLESPLFQYVLKRMRFTILERNLVKRNYLDEFFESDFYHLLGVNDQTLSRLLKSEPLPNFISVAQLQLAALKHALHNATEPEESTTIENSGNGFVSSWTVEGLDLSTYLGSSPELIGWLETCPRTGQLVFADATGCIELGSIPAFDTETLSELVGCISKDAPTTARPVRLLGTLEGEGNKQHLGKKAFQYAELERREAPPIRKLRLVPLLGSLARLGVTVEVMHHAPDVGVGLQRVIMRGLVDTANPEGGQGSLKELSWASEWHENDSGMAIKMAVHPLASRVIPFTRCDLQGVSPPSATAETGSEFEFEHLFCLVQDIKPVRFTTEGDMVGKVFSRITGMFWVDGDSLQSVVPWPIKGEIIPLDETCLFFHWFPVVQIGFTYRFSCVKGRIDNSWKRFPGGYGKFAASTNTEVEVMDPPITPQRQPKIEAPPTLLAVSQVMDVAYWYNKRFGEAKSRGGNAELVSLVGKLKRITLQKQPKNMSDVRKVKQLAKAGYRIPTILQDYSILLELQDEVAPVHVRVYIEQRARYVPHGLVVGSKILIRNAQIAFRAPTSPRVRYVRVTDTSNIEIISCIAKNPPSEAVQLASLPRVSLNTIALKSHRDWNSGGFCALKLQCTKLSQLQVGWKCEQCKNMLPFHLEYSATEAHGVPKCPGEDCLNSKLVFTCTCSFEVSDGTGTGILNASGEQGMTLAGFGVAERNILAKQTLNFGTIEYPPQQFQDSEIDVVGAKADLAAKVDKYWSAEPLLCYVEVLPVNSLTQGVGQYPAGTGNKRNRSNWGRRKIDVGGVETDTCTISSVRLEVIHVQHIDVLHEIHQLLSLVTTDQ